MTSDPAFDRLVRQLTIEVCVMGMTDMMTPVREARRKAEHAADMADDPDLVIRGRETPQWYLSHRHEVMSVLIALETLGYSVINRQ
jgi:hypothetical protein